MRNLVKGLVPHLGELAIVGGVLSIWGGGTDEPK